MTVQSEVLDKREFTLVEHVMQHIVANISARKLVVGMKLPSLRKLAQTMKVSKSTVVEAYDRLVAEGTIQPRKGSGFYVAGHLPPLELSELAPKLEHAIDPLWVSRESLEAGEDVLKPGCGWLPEAWMPHQSIRRALRSLSRADPAILTQYGTPHGFKPLRELLVRRMANLSIAASLDQIVLMDSGTQTIDLLCRYYLEPGDTVLVDDPCYFNFHALLKAHRVKIVSVPYTPSGPNLDLFEQALLDHKPRLYITNSAIHNPTGAVLSPLVAHQLLKLADQSDLIIIEDDIFSDFETTPAPRLAALDGLNRVVHISSFSKTLSAAARCGFIAAPMRWINGIIDLKIATTFGGHPFSAQLTYLVLKDGAYPKHLGNLRDRLSKAFGQTAMRLRSIGIEPWITPTAGMYLWCKLPHELMASELASKALAHNIVLAPGNVFSLSQTASQFLRFNVAQSASPKIYDFLEATIREKQ